MAVGIIDFFNAMVGFIFRENIYKCKKYKHPSGYPTFRRVLQYITTILAIVSYMVHMLFIVQGDYKFAICVLLISVSSLNASNQIFYTQKAI